MRTALIAGATGLVGDHLVRHLLHHQDYQRVIALVRRPLPLQHPKLEVRYVDFARLEPWEVPDADVFCALGTTIRKAGSREAFRQVDLELPGRLAACAVRAGASRFLVVSSVGAARDASSFYQRTKGEMEDRVGASGVSAVHLFRPSFLMGDRPERRTWEAFGIALALRARFLLVGSLRKYRPIHGETVARGMISAALGGRAGRFVYHYDEIKALAHQVPRIDPATP